MQGTADRRPRGVLRWLARCAALAAVLGCGQRPAPPDIVLISVDTLRADHLDAWGYSRRTAPAVTALADQGVRFEQAISASSWTLPSMATLHTSLYPTEHGAVGAKRQLAADHLTLAEALRSAGYDTMGVTSHTFVDRKRGFAQGFASFDESQIQPHDAITSSQLTEVALGLLADRDVSVRQAPFFLWVHYFDPHYTYVRHPRFDFASNHGEPLSEQLNIMVLRELARAQDEQGRPSLAAEKVEFVKAVYDEEIANTDQAIGALLEGIEALDPSRRRVVVLTADHGEMFMEHGHFGHEQGYLYQQIVHVPLVIGGSIPRRLRGQVVKAPVEVRSVAHTLARLAGLTPNPFGGRDLLELAQGAPPGAAYTEARPPYRPTPWRVAVVADGWKLIHDRTNDSFELYDLEADPGERHNRWTDATGAAADARSRLQPWLEGFRPEPPATVPRHFPAGADAERLKALGYIE